MTAAASSSRAPYVLVVTDRACEASDVLFFEHLAVRMPRAVRIARVGVDNLAAALAGASALIIVRSLIELGYVGACARRLGVPSYFFLDDNFMLLREEPDPFATWFAAYSDDGVREALREFEGALLATPALVGYCRAHQLHERLTLYPPVAGPQVRRSTGPASRPLTVAFFGGAHRRDAFVQWVYPALRRVAERRDVILVAAGVDAVVAPSVGRLQVVHQPYNPSYSRALEDVGRHEVDILVHPGNASINNPYKNPHVLINAWMLGAAPIFSRLPPYDAVEGDRVAVLCDNTTDGWYRAIDDLAADASERRAIVERLASYCAAQFGGAVNEAAIAAMLNTHPAPTEPEARRRRLRGTMCLGITRVSGLARRAVRRVTRSAQPNPAATRGAR